MSINLEKLCSIAMQGYMVFYFIEELNYSKINLVKCVLYNAIAVLDLV